MGNIVSSGSLHPESYYVEVICSNCGKRREIQLRWGEKINDDNINMSFESKSDSECQICGCTEYKKNG